jgi:uncharacterized membrane protein
MVKEFNHEGVIRNTQSITKEIQIEINAMCDFVISFVSFVVIIKYYFNHEGVIRNTQSITKEIQI